MSQKIFGLGLGGTGIVAVLIVGGILISKLTTNQAAGNLAIYGGIGIGGLLGILGVIGILITLGRRMGL